MLSKTSMPIFGKKWFSITFVSIFFDVVSKALY